MRELEKDRMAGVEKRKEKKRKEKERKENESKERRKGNA
jgi:hypothetical protein